MYFQPVLPSRAYSQSDAESWYGFQLQDLGDMIMIADREPHAAGGSGAWGPNTPSNANLRSKSDDAGSVHNHAQPLSSSPPQLPMSPQELVCPPEYEERDFEFFQSGLIFKIWAPRTQLHERQFVLLDTARNTEGLALVVHLPDPNKVKGHFYSNHVHIQDYADKASQVNTKHKVVYMSEFQEEQIPEYTFICIDHAFNISFKEHKFCVDCGYLDDSSINKIRRYYLQWMERKWFPD